MADTSGYRYTPTGLELIEQVGAVFAGEPLFLRGFGAGVESESWPGRTANDRGTNSPITLLATMPAWEGSNRTRGHEQDFRYSIGAVVGAFATRSGIDTDELYEQFANLQKPTAADDTGGDNYIQKDDIGSVIYDFRTDED